MPRSGTMPYTLRPVAAGDEALLLEIYASTRADEMALLEWTDAQKSEFVRMQFTAQHEHYQKAFPEARFDIVLSGDAPVGRLYVDRRADEMRIIDIALLPAHRNRGLGGAILKELLAESAAAGKPVRIHVERNNPALRLYQRLGFQQIDETGIYLLMERTAHGI